MGAFTLEEFRVKVLHKLALPDDDAMALEADLTESIAAGQRAMATDFDWPWLIFGSTFATVAGTQLYALPVEATGPPITHEHVRTLWIGNPTLGYTLNVRERQEVERYIVTRGLPSIYAVQGGAISLGPVPDAVYTLKHVYIRPDTPMTDDDETSLCPDHFSDVIVLYACISEATRTKDFTQVAQFRQELAEWKQRMRDNVRQSAGTLRVRTRSDYGTW
jgi:hypothetical protein